MSQEVSNQRMLACLVSPTCIAYTLPPLHGILPLGATA